MTEPNEELLPCPWCNRYPKFISDGENYALECVYAKCPSNFFGSKVMAINQWNTRYVPKQFSGYSTETPNE